MAEYMTLIGSDDVRSAGRNMQDAAERIERAMSQFNTDVGRLSSILDEHAMRIEHAIAQQNKRGGA